MENTIPEFPNFKRLCFCDKNEIGKWVKKHPPYSDYNFTSMWTWNNGNVMKVSQLYGNLIIIFSDYISSERFFSLLGTRLLLPTIKKLIDYSKIYGLSSDLRLIPESVVSTLKSEIFDINLNIYEDDANHDYILSVEKMKNMSGKKLGPKRNFINRFKKKYGKVTEVKRLSLLDSAVQKEILDLFCVWQKKSKKTCAETNDEYNAIKRTLKNAHRFNLCAIGIYIDNILVAFSIDEVLHDEYGIIHYEKADIEKIGIYQFLKQQSAHMFAEMGCKYINYEQDLGIEGLRKAKKSHAPINMLKKYRIEPSFVKSSI